MAIHIVVAKHYAGKVIEDVRMRKMYCHYPSSIYLSSNITMVSETEARLQPPAPKYDVNTSNSIFRPCRQRQASK